MMGQGERKCDYQPKVKSIVFINIKDCVFDDLGNLTSIKNNTGESPVKINIKS